MIYQKIATPPLHTLLLACLAILTVGCGGDLGPMGTVSGKLTMEGSLLPKDTKVLFMEPLSGYIGFGFTDDQGNYSIEMRRSGQTYNALPVATYEVMIIPSDYVDVDELSADEMMEGAPEVSQGNIPAKYMRGATSGLKYQIAEGANEVNIDLTSK